MDLSSHPRHPRSSVMLMATLWRETGGEATQHRVLNISETGIGLAGAAGLRVGATVLLSIGSVTHAAADVMWVRAGQAGLRFHAAVDTALARQRRTGAIIVPRAGWIDELRPAYRR